MGKLGGTNTKKEAGMAKKTAIEKEKQDKLDRERAKQEEAEWQKGANSKRAKAEEEKALKADEAARKRREKAELLEQEESEVPDGGGKGKKLLQAAKKKSSGKKKNDLSLLEDALQSSADKAAKKKKAELAAKKKREEEAIAAKAAAAKEKEASADPLLVNTETMIGNDEEIGRMANQARMEAADTSGINAALGTLNVHGSVVTSAKALYTEFETRMLPIVKAEHPGLRLSQYKEKIFVMWKKSPDNPANHPDNKKKF